MRILNEYKQTRFEKLQEIIDREVRIGIYNMESWNKNILETKLVQNEKHYCDNIENNQDDI